MAVDIKDQKLLYHLTDLDNLPSIFQRGLQPRSALLRDGFKDIADAEILEGRSKQQLDDYVPFHFFAGNPFDGRVQKDHPDGRFVLITVRRDIAKANNWKIIPTHPLSGSHKILEYDEGFSAIDWTLVNTRDYKNDNCKHVCMAECLSEEVVLPERFFSIYVKTFRDWIDVLKLKQKYQVSCYLNHNAKMFLRAADDIHQP
ncbi:DarT ssDNA thymidine ADP-ribosyltransferase family protein [Thalassolituus oleivorans]|uniref:DarT ssDNA thymidine ADP-ribosyltransferase family protein n=1 Tax=Thalassolituus oleivorans TaxID=187493 RepID=UPI0023EFB66B|nr:DarT ssDNA thymidine ADP-ribosyltransferase family protein [Thalassolituus oleivorans]